MSWVDDLLACGPDQNKLKPELDAMDDQFECEDGGELKEYVGCKIEYDRKIPIMKLTQPVLIQSFEDEFEVNKLGRDVSTPAIPNTVIVTKAEKEGTEKDKTYMRSGVGKLLHLVRWSKPEIFNAVRELTRVTSEAGAEHIEAMKRCMKYCVQTKERGRVIKPTMTWNGNKNFLHKIWGKSDSDFAKESATRCSVSRWGVFLNGVSISEKSKMQDLVAISVTEAEAIAGIGCAQDMIFAMHVLHSMELEVELPMILWMDNKGAVDLFNGWSVTGRTRHMGTKINFMRELKEEGTLIVKWFPSEDNSSDMFTKNLGGTLFEKHMKDYVTDEKVEKDKKTSNSAKGRVSEDENNSGLHWENMARRATK